ncbi:response regulator [Nonomuraea angiospora]|uniref:response regulator transcription factor n=1 Tax=Nonomuraea angiospora TaxID=46172 RepID=UPI00341C7E2E
MIKTNYPDVAIVLVTALSRPEEVIAGLERGADDHVTKPFHPRELVLRALLVTVPGPDPQGLPAEGTNVTVGIDPGRAYVPTKS